MPLVFCICTTSGLEAEVWEPTRPGQALTWQLRPSHTVESL